MKDVQLRLTGHLDRERQADYNLTLVALDGVRPARSAVLAVRVLVADANDHAPTFAHPEYLVQVREDVAPGQSDTRSLCGRSDRWRRYVVK